MPERIQRKRVKGWKMPPNTVSVTRPGKWSNPFKVDDLFLPEDAVEMFENMMNDLSSYKVTDEIYNHFRYMRDRIKDLQGKNLACFCAIGKPCHADVLLKIANQ